MVICPEMDHPEASLAKAPLSLTSDREESYLSLLAEVGLCVDIKN